MNHYTWKQLIKPTLGMLMIPVGLLLIGACSPIDEPDSVPDSVVQSHPIQCIDGVEYFTKQWPTGYGISVKFNPDSTVSTC